MSTLPDERYQGFYPCLTSPGGLQDCDTVSIRTSSRFQKRISDECMIAKTRSCNCWSCNCSLRFFKLAEIARAVVKDSA